MCLYSAARAGFGPGSCAHSPEEHNETNVLPASSQIFPAGFITSLLCLAAAASAAAVNDCASEVVGNMGNLIDNFVSTGDRDRASTRTVLHSAECEWQLVNQLPLDYGVTVWGPQDNRTVCLCRARVKPDSLATALKRLTKDVGKSEGASSKCLSSPATTKNTESTDHCANKESRAGMSAESPSGVDTWRISAFVFMGTTGVLLVYLVVRNENNAPNGGGAPEGRAAATAHGLDGQGTPDDAGWHCERRRRSLATHWSMRNCHVPLQHAELQTLMELRSATGMEADNQSDDPGTVDNLV
ncbi:unnamed protein product [Lampetra planeri]